MLRSCAPTEAFVDGVKIGWSRREASCEPLRQGNAADGSRVLVVLPAGADELEPRTMHSTGAGWLFFDEHRSTFELALVRLADGWKAGQHPW